MEDFRKFKRQNRNEIATVSLKLFRSKIRVTEFCTDFFKDLEAMYSQNTACIIGCSDAVVVISEIPMK